MTPVQFRALFPPWPVRCGSISPVHQLIRPPGGADPGPNQDTVADAGTAPRPLGRIRTDWAAMEHDGLVEQAARAGGSIDLEPIPGGVRYAFRLPLDGTGPHGPGRLS